MDEDDDGPKMLDSIVGANVTDVVGINVEFIPDNKVTVRVPSLLDHNNPSSSITDVDDDAGALYGDGIIPPCPSGCGVCCGYCVVFIECMCCCCCCCCCCEYHPCCAAAATVCTCTC